MVEVLEFDDDLSWTVYDHIVDGILGSGEDVVKSGSREVYQGGKIIRLSRRTIDHAINSPFGRFTAALFNAVPREKEEDGLLIPSYIKSRVEHFFAAPGEGSDHAVTIENSKLNWLLFVDPAWTKEHLVPMLTFKHPASDPAWNGFLYCG